MPSNVVFTLKLTSNYNNTDNFLEIITVKELNQLEGRPETTWVPKSAMLCPIPHLGYLIEVELHETLEGAPTGVTDVKRPLPPSTLWDYVFMNETHAYFKSPCCRDLDREFGDLQARILDKEAQICETLQSEVLSVKDDLVEAGDLAAQLDCILTLAKVATEFGWTLPELTERNLILIEEGQHPLVEVLSESPFIPNSIFIEGAESPPRSRLGTDSSVVRQDGGQSASGSSGSPETNCRRLEEKLADLRTRVHVLTVPARSAVIGVCDKVFSRIQTVDSATVHHSAFGIDLKQVSCALRHCTPRSLLLLDEFGKGTSCSDGVGLLSGTLRYLANEALSPKTICTTHFQEIFKQNLLGPSLPLDLKVFTMTIILPDANSADSELTFLHKMEPGCADHSYGEGESGPAFGSGVERASL
uniref:DNA mismatch repair proteins mutS family domain-containing protein n=1 Tax=Chromera velia CCMP2878 TaxID=1169474 RepID=A0A0G4HV24_9ALVE|eukprot:Cvel_8769.t1-p1 / transcript=Cvel_8769.t1 / gene=Cvel_8769 / organism=Chromera_velia_CCMP2878 / gene_product=DNA mismatch repair protein MSH5, putative / transcript_product=DNA mismatch repair protein MSH5, putative / location=Cvel_scaffold490:53171-54956(-) / protein_length=415 / sequence_SO=supercontig / SO=protein_coding / is_pseudo=false